MTSLFVSDLHLDAARPAATACFGRFLDTVARKADHLYILGDLFEVWIGDDAPGTHDQQVINALRELTRAGVPCSLLPGNRDFLIGSRFARQTGVRLLEDECRIELGGESVLLMHGDTLCTDDTGYQAYRRIVHHPAIRATYLALPAGLRRRIATYARSRSAAANAGKPAAIMDVSPAAVVAALRRHSVRFLVHGHTHRPGSHEIMLDGLPAHRIVLGDWYDQGSVLAWTDKGPDLQTLPFG